MKITIIIQRYGEAIVGGAEAHARTIAHILAQWHEVTVVTTTANDHHTWRNTLAAGEEADGPVRVLRFRVERERTSYWQELDRLAHGSMGGSAVFPLLPPAAKADFRRRLEGWPLGLQEEYIRWQGPYPPQLFAWLQENSVLQDRFLFFTYLYPTTYFGMPCVLGEKTDFHPTLHDELAAYFPAFRCCFHRPNRLLFSTETERQLAKRLYGIPTRAGEILGYGMKPPLEGSGVSANSEPFFLYAGRIEVNKGIPALLQYFIRWKDENPQSPLRLILTGKNFLDLPQHPALEYRGFVSEEEKETLLRQALALVHPSPLESLGFIILEAFLCGTPALVYGKSEVLVDHCRLSNGGLWYEDYAEFAEALLWFLTHPEQRKLLGAQGRSYAQKHYGMEGYLKRLAALYPPE